MDALRAWLSTGAAVALTAGTALSAPALGATHRSAKGRQAQFAAAAKEFGVPQRLLLAVSYAETRWDAHSGQPSTNGAYGPMALTDVSATSRDGGRGAGGTHHTVSDPAAHRLISAAKLIHASSAAVRHDPRQNIRAGAALLAHGARRLLGTTPRRISQWYPVVAAYSGSTTDEALTFADDVYAALAHGAARSTDDGGGRVSMSARRVTPDKSKVARLHLHTPHAHKAECPVSLHCGYVPAAYAQTDPNDKSAYGNYDTAHRPRDLRIRYIVIHDTEETFDQTKQTFTDPKSQVSANYVVRSDDGAITQMVPDSAVAWQAGNWYVNTHSIGVEHEGYEVQGAAWYTEPMYRHSARLVRYLALRYGIPLDRAHIIGHENVPGTSPSTVAGMHTDPGPFWNWAHYMRLVRGGAPDRAHRGGHGDVVTISPKFATNRPPVTACDPKCHSLPRQSDSAVYLRTKPSKKAPLLSDPALHPKGGPGTTKIDDWGDQASTGQQFAVAKRSGDWLAIWYGGTMGWLYDPHAHPVTTPSRGHLITPRGKSAPVYGVAYPQASEYPKQIPAQPAPPLQYRIRSGQRYVAYDKFRPDYYYAKTIDSSLPLDHTVVRGHRTYYVIQLGHRIGYVRAADVRTA